MDFIYVYIKARTVKRVALSSFRVLIFVHLPIIPCSQHKQPGTLSIKAIRVQKHLCVYKQARNICICSSYTNVKCVLQTELTDIYAKHIQKPYGLSWLSCRKICGKILNGSCVCCTQNTLQYQYNLSFVPVLVYTANESGINTCKFIHYLQTEMALGSDSCRQSCL